MRSIFSKSSPSQSPPNPRQESSLSASLMDESIETAHSLISKWNDSETWLFSHDRNEARQYISAVYELHAAMQLLTPDRLAHAQSLMQLAGKRLQRELCHILSSNLDEPGPVSDLKLIAECMISSGNGKECVRTYKSRRKSVVDEALCNLGVERLTLSQVQKMEWSAVEAKIKSWLNAVKVAVKRLFHGERRLCDHVFSGSEAMREACFSEIAKEGAVTLLGFPELVAKCKKSPEKMFRTLDLYEAITVNWAEMEGMFSESEGVRAQGLNSLSRLGDAVRAMLADFEDMVQKDASKKELAGGGVHPATRYIMNYIQFLADYSDTLAHIIADWPAPPSPQSYFESSNSSPISLRFAWLILVLLCKLDGKAQLYKDVPLSYLFLANNLHYIVAKVRSSNLRHLLGEDWIATHESKVNQYASSYERLGWGKAVSALPGETDMSIQEARDCFRRFNQAFADAYAKQLSWVVSDAKLREQIKHSLAHKLQPPYRLLYQRYRIPLREESCVRYAPEDLDNYLSELFNKIGGSESGTVSSTSCPFPTQSRLGR